MKNKILVLFITFFTTSNLFSQTSLKAGDKAPTITITDYISNIAKDKTLNNKYILLEFWATWCAPCLGAVPHLNELQAKYKNRKDISIISMTYESPEIVLKTLKRIDFKTIVVSDQTEKSQTDFGVKQNGSMTLPRTVLIDNKGVVKWIGVPDQMTDSLFDSFLKGDDITTITDSVPKNIENKTKADLKDENSIDIAMKLLRDKQTQYSFSLLESIDNHGSSSRKNPLKGQYSAINCSFKKILSELLNVTEMQLEIPELINNKKYSLFYKNVNIVDEKKCIEDIKTNLLKSLDLREKIESRMVEVYFLKVIDKNKLQILTEKDYQSHWGENDTHLVFSNIPVGTLIKEVSNLQKMHIIDETNLIENYYFLLRKDSKENLKKDLESYGLTLEKVDKSVDYYIYE
jgi:uncharacterized protein (TIGR03435 family)